MEKQREREREREKERERENQMSLVTFNWKTKRLKGEVKKKIKMTIWRILKTL